MKVLVCGGRNYLHREHVFMVLDSLEPSVVIHGGARGADQLAGAWAKERKVEFRKYPAQWNRYGKSAGFRRNEQMLNEENPDLVIAFPGGNGTAHMVRIARQRGYRVTEITP